MKSHNDQDIGNRDRYDADGEVDGLSEATGQEDFFRRAAERILPDPTPDDRKAHGDHVLNSRWSPHQGVTFTDAAGLVPVGARKSGASVLLTRRTSHLSSHPGQIAFPGGKIDPDDADPAQAALREAREEIGLRPDMVEVIGYLDTYLSRPGFRIVPVLARVSERFVLEINPAEVEEVFEVPLAFLLNEANHRRGSRQLMGGEAIFYEIPFEERYIWGVTAGIIRTLTNRMAD